MAGSPLPRALEYTAPGPGLRSAVLRGCRIPAMGFGNTCSRTDHRIPVSEPRAEVRPHWPPRILHGGQAAIPFCHASGGCCGRRQKPSPRPSRGPGCMRGYPPSSYPACRGAGQRACRISAPPRHRDHHHELNDIVCQVSPETWAMVIIHKSTFRTGIGARTGRGHGDLQRILCGAGKAHVPDSPSFSITGNVLP